MNKTLYIFFAVIILLVIAIAFTLVNQDSSSVGVITNVEYTDLSVTFQSSNGSDITADNFLKNETVKEDVSNPGLYELGNTVEVDQVTGKAPKYAAIYDKESGVFNIMLLEKPFTQSRTEAEGYLKNLLQISDDEMCKLSYSVTVPGYVDQNASGQDFRFSFCPDAVTP